MDHNENCECCRCQQIPQKPYEEYSNAVLAERYNPCVYHHYCQSPCLTCGRTHFQQSTSVIGTLPVEFEIQPAMSIYPTPPQNPTMSSCGKSNISLRQSSMSQRKTTIINGTGNRKSTLKRNGLDAAEEDPSKNIALQTCKDTGVGDCPACLGNRTNCHANECQLCCEVKVCGPSYKNCPFIEGTEVQTDPVCDSTGMACKCGADCGLNPCTIGENCEDTLIECRCFDRGCNTSKHCLIMDDTCFFTEKECRCSTKDCDTDQACVVIVDDSDCDPAYNGAYTDDPTCSTYNNNYGNPADEDLIRRCHAVCQTTFLDSSPEKSGNANWCQPHGAKMPNEKKCKFFSSKKKSKAKKSIPLKQCASSSGNETDHYSIVLDDDYNEQERSERICRTLKSNASSQATLILQQRKSRSATGISRSSSTINASARKKLICVRKNQLKYDADGYNLNYDPSYAQDMAWSTAAAPRSVSAVEFNTAASRSRISPSNFASFYSAEDQSGGTRPSTVPRNFSVAASKIVPSPSIAASRMTQQMFATPSRMTQQSFAAPRMTQQSFAASRKTQQSFAAPGWTQQSFAAPRMTQQSFAAPRQTQQSFAAASRKTQQSFAVPQMTTQQSFAAAPSRRTQQSIAPTRMTLNPSQYQSLARISVAPSRLSTKQQSFYQTDDNGRFSVSPSRMTQGSVSPSSSRKSTYASDQFNSYPSMMFPSRMTMQSRLKSMINGVRSIKSYCVDPEEYNMMYDDDEMEDEILTRPSAISGRSDFYDDDEDNGEVGYYSPTATPAELACLKENTTNTINNNNNNNDVVEQVSADISTPTASDELGVIHKTTSEVSRRHSAFDDLPLIVEEDGQDIRTSFNAADMTDQENFEVTVEEIPMANGETRSKISIKAIQASNQQITDSSKVNESTQSSDGIDYENNEQLAQQSSSVIIVPQIEKSQTRESDTPSEKKESGKGLTQYSQNKPKSQVHFNINIQHQPPPSSLDENNKLAKLAVIKRNVQSQSKTGLKPPSPSTSLSPSNKHQNNAPKN